MSFGDALPQHDCGLFLEHNEHKYLAISIQDWLASDKSLKFAWRNEAAKSVSIETDEIWTLEWYTDTPLYSFGVAAPNLDELLQWAREYEQM